MVAIEFNNVSFQYTPQVKILENLDFSIQKGEFISIIGPSGSGKTTILKLINGLELPDNGVIKINDKFNENKLGKVGYMPQSDMLLPWRTVWKNILISLELKGRHKNDLELEKAKHLLESFGLKNAKETYPKNLSGGMKQRASFLRAILTGSNILLLDEPFSALDAITKKSMQSWLLNQWKTNMNQTILFVTHDVDEAIFLSEKILVLKENPIDRVYLLDVPYKQKENLTFVEKSQRLQLKDRLLHLLKGLDL